MTAVMDQVSPTTSTKFVVLRGLERGNVFWTSYDAKKDTPDSIRRLATGDLVYEVLAYCDTPEEAKQVWQGRLGWVLR